MRGRDKRTTLERFWGKVNKTDTCWERTRGLLSGYGLFFIVKGKKILAHRYSYIIHKGDIPEGMFILHSCDNRKCVNPEHLSIGTHQDNMNDMLSKGRQNNQLKTHCKYGHEFTLDNTKYNSRGSRFCKECVTQYQANWYLNKKLLKDGNTK